MEYYWTLHNSTRTNGSSNSDSNVVRGHFGNIPSHAWDQSSWNLIGTHNINSNGNANANYPPPNNNNNTAGAFHSPNGPQDPHLTCLKLGKRHCFEDVVVSPERHVAAAVARKGKAYCGGPTAPGCQVEGCESVLENAKGYHRRHKVCEMHAKAPRVMVHGAEQRFCQQCSRFHAVAEFDESKRSCRRRLAGHNQRRRKSSQEQHSVARRNSQDIQMMGTGKYSHLLTSSSECALSLLSSSSSSTSYNNPWNYTSPSSSADDLPARCSAALRELIAENRASVLARSQLLKVNSNHIVTCNNNNNNNSSYRLGLGRDGPSLSASGGHVTLDLMQNPDSAFGLLSVHDHKSSKEGNGEDCSELWRVPLGY